VPQVGVLLPTFDTFRTGGVPSALEAARRAEELGFDAVWVGDHLACPAPNLDAPSVLAAAAAVTRRVRLGFSILLLGLRPPAWTAKQLATVDLLSGGRLELGVGVGGEFPREFAAADVPLHQRGARLDETLAVLPDLLAGRPVRHSGLAIEVDSPALEPSLNRVPRLLVGGRSEAAMRRAARFGDTWLPMWLTPGRLAERAGRLTELAAEQGRPTPTLALLVGVHVDADEGRARAEADGHLRGQYSLGLESVERWTALGSIELVLSQLEPYLSVGVDELVLMPLAREPLAQYERLAEVGARLRGLEGVG
jgi:probable F420-dependent oxidoreductase